MYAAILTALILALASPAQAARPCCDLNDDGAEPTVKDWAAFLGAFGKKEGDAGYIKLADFDGNKAITAADFGLMSQYCPLTDK